MTEGEILDGIILREGDAVKNDPVDPQDPSKYGIGALTLGNWRGWNRKATLAEMSALSRFEAIDIYRSVFIKQPGFTIENVPFEPLRVQLIDFGVNSGPELAVRWLQRIIGVQPDGLMGPRTAQTLRAWAMYTVGPRTALHFVNDALVSARLSVIDRLADTRPGYKKYEEGLEDRALSFRLA